MRKKKPFFKKKIFWGVLSVFLFGALFYFFFFSETFQVEKILVSGQKSISREKIEKAARSLLESRFLNLKSQSIIFLDTGRVEKKLLESFPRMASLAIEKSPPDSLLLKVEERVPAAEIFFKEKCFSLDKEGIAFRETERTELLEIEKKLQEAFPGSRALSKEEMEAALFLEKEIESKTSLKALKINIENCQKYQVQTDKGWLIFFNAEKDLEWQVEKLSLLLREEIDLEKNPPSEYIDLRFEKAYYK